MKYRNVILAITALIVVGLVLSNVGSSTTKVSGTVTPVDIESTTLPTSKVTEVPLLVKKKISRITLEADSIIKLDTEVNQQSVEALISKLESYTSGDVFLLIDSPGGSVFDGARLISYMEASSARIHTVCYALCASMAAHIHQHGKTRLMIDRSALMFHPAAGGVRGTVPEMRSLLGFIELEVNKLDAYIARRANKRYDEFKVLSDRNIWIAADDAVREGYADGIVVVNYPRSGEVVFSLGEEMRKKGIVIKTSRPANPLTDIK